MKTLRLGIAPLLLALTLAPGCDKEADVVAGGQVTKGTSDRGKRYQDPHGFSLWVSKDAKIKAESQDRKADGGRLEYRTVVITNDGGKSELTVLSHAYSGDVRPELATEMAKGLSKSMSADGWEVSDKLAECAIDGHKGMGFEGRRKSNRIKGCTVARDAHLLTLAYEWLHLRKAGQDVTKPLKTFKWPKAHRLQAATPSGDQQHVTSKKGG